VENLEVEMTRVSIGMGWSLTGLREATTFSFGIARAALLAFDHEADDGAQPVSSRRIQLLTSVATTRGCGVCAK